MNSSSRMNSTLIPDPTSRYSFTSTSSSSSESSSWVDLPLHDLRGFVSGDFNGGGGGGGGGGHFLLNVQRSSSFTQCW